MAGKDERTFSKALNAKKRSKVIVSVIMCLLGIVLLIWPNQALNVACRIVGLALCVAGIVGVVMFFVSKEKTAVITLTMAMGVIIGFIGFWIFLNPHVLAALIPAIIGAFIIISGIINISEAITIHKENGSGAVATLVIALLTIALGVVIFLNPRALNAILVRLIGISLIFDGVSDIWIVSRISGKVREVSQDLKAARGEAVDENGDPVRARTYAPDDTPEAKASKEGAEDAEVKPLKKGFFHRNKKSDVVSETHFDYEPPKDFTETHNYTTTTVKRPAHVSEEAPAEETAAAGTNYTELHSAGAAHADAAGSSAAGEEKKPSADQTGADTPADKESDKTAE